MLAYARAGQVSARLGRLGRMRKGAGHGESRASDVARLAGVSQPTVSRALRDDPRSRRRPSSRCARPPICSATSRAMPAGRCRAGRTRRIGLLVTDLDNQFYAHVIAPDAPRARAPGLPADAPHRDRRQRDGRRTADRQRPRRRDPGHDHASTRSLPAAAARPRLPFVYFNRTAVVRRRRRQPSSTPAAGLRRGRRDAPSRSGHRRIGAILGPRNTSTAQSPRDRAARGARGARPRARTPQLRAARPVRLRHRATTATTSLLGLPTPPTLIFCGNDVVALRRTQRRRRAGRRGPRARSRSSASTTCRPRRGRSSS